MDFKFDGYTSKKDYCIDCLENGRYKGPEATYRYFKDKVTFAKEFPEILEKPHFNVNSESEIKKGELCEFCGLNYVVINEESLNLSVLSKETYVNLNDTLGCEEMENVVTALASFSTAEEFLRTTDYIDGNGDKQNIFLDVVNDGGFKTGYSETNGRESETNDLIKSFVYSARKCVEMQKENSETDNPMENNNTQEDFQA